MLTSRLKMLKVDLPEYAYDSSLYSEKKSKKYKIGNGFQARNILMIEGQLA